MPGPVQDLIVTPSVQTVTVSTEPAQNVFNSLSLLNKVEHMSGLGEWVIRTAAALTPQEQATHRLVTIGLHYAAFPHQSWPSFPTYVDHLATLDPLSLRDKLMRTYARFSLLEDGACYGMLDEPLPIDLDAVLESVDTFLDFLRARFAAKHIDERLEARAFEYVVDPPTMKTLIVSHLQKMWEAYLAPEWERVGPMLRDAVTAFRQIDFGPMERLEAAQLIAGQTLEEEKWAKVLKEAERVIFAPSAHTGPYLTRFHVGHTLWVFFGARIPQGVKFHAPDLSRAEILMRLNALSDDNRLNILRLISERGEMRSQEIMVSLGLSQSAASRHLKQLSATGYLLERRCNGAKCYQINPERIENTLHALSAFLLGK